MGRFVYLDNQSTTQIAPEAFDSMLPYLQDKYGNPSSNHRFGKKIRADINKAREIVARSINAEPEEIIFTSGTTEAVNVILKGVSEKSGGRNHIITTSTEHKAVLNTCKFLEGKGFCISYLSVDSYGRIDLNELRSTISDQTVLVSVMHANNEIGTIQPISEISKICQENNILVFSDGAQAFGKVQVDIEELGVDFYSISSHKVYGPKGIGALYIRKNSKTQLSPFLYGGGQESGLRSGTENVPGIIGFSKACELAEKELEEDSERILLMRNRLKEGIIKNIPEIKINGSLENRLPGNLNVTFCDVESDLIIRRLTDIGLSAGSACSTNTLAPSHVLLSLGLSHEEANSSLRFSVGRYNTMEEIEYVIDRLTTEISKIRKTLAYGSN